MASERKRLEPSKRRVLLLKDMKTMQHFSDEAQEGSLLIPEFQHGLE